MIYLVYLITLDLALRTGIIATLRRWRSTLPIAGRWCSRHMTVAGGRFVEFGEMSWPVAQMKYWVLLLSIAM